jgi:hypothetical protein
MHRTQHQDRAVKISEKSLDMITVANGGVRPEVTEETTYFITCGHDTCVNLILPEKDFRLAFEFTETESETEFKNVQDPDPVD